MVRQLSFVRVYNFNSTTNQWNQLGDDINGEAACDSSGNSVSLSLNGKTVAIGAAGNDDNGSNSGHVCVYTFNSSMSQWNQLGDDIDGEASSDVSGGYSLSLSSNGKTVAIGALGNDGNGIDSGHVHVFNFNSNNNEWTQLGDDIDGKAVDDWSSYDSVSLSSGGNRVVIGAYRNDDNGSNSGHVHVYEFDSINNQWTKLGDDINGEVAHDYSGVSVSLSLFRQKDCCDWCLS